MLVLASASPRRRELLAQAGFAFDVHPAHIPEEPYPGEETRAYVIRLAREKAEAVYKELMGATNLASDVREGTKVNASEERASAPPLMVLVADTTVAIDGHILGKPDSAADAARMLHLLSGRTHRVLTGIALVTASSTQADAEETAVSFLSLTDTEIEAYIASGEPMDKAGAYAIQGRAARWIPRIEGCYFNVVGLPIARVASMLEGRTARLLACRPK